MTTLQEKKSNLSSDELAAYAAAFNLLGSCYRLAPDSEAMAVMLNVFNLSDWMESWPANIPEDQQKAFAPLTHPAMPSLKDEWRLLFVGPAANPAPPWGSVYLDPEKLLQGQSTQKLNAFLKREKLTLKTSYPEPVDHIGLILFQAAFLAKEEREGALLELLKEHLHPWLPLYLDQQEKAKVSEFYTALTKLTLMTVESLL